MLLERPCSSSAWPCPRTSQSAGNRAFVSAAQGSAAPPPLRSECDACTSKSVECGTSAVLRRTQRGGRAAKLRGQQPPPVHFAPRAVPPLQMMPLLWALTQKRNYIHRIHQVTIISSNFQQLPRLSQALLCSVRHRKHRLNKYQGYNLMTVINHPAINQMCKATIVRLQCSVFYFPLSATPFSSKFVYKDFPSITH